MISEQKIDNAAVRYLQRSQALEVFDNRIDAAMKNVEQAEERGKNVSIENLKFIGIIACSIARVIVLVPGAKKDEKVLDSAYEIYAREGESLTDFAMRRAFDIDMMQ